MGELRELEAALLEYDVRAKRGPLLGIRRQALLAPFGLAVGEAGRSRGLQGSLRRRARSRQERSARAKAFEKEPHACSRHQAKNCRRPFSYVPRECNEVTLSSTMPMSFASSCPAVLRGSR